MKNIIQLIKFYRNIRKQYKQLEDYLEQYQPVGHLGKIQRIMNIKYRPQND